MVDLKIIKPLILILLFIPIVFFSTQIIRRGVQNQIHKRNYAELHHFKYGLFSVNTWKDKLSDIITKEIDNLYLTRSSEKALKKHLEIQLGILIDKIYNRIKKENYETTQGWFKQNFMENFIDINEIKKGIPEYAQAMMKEMRSKRTEKQIKKILKEKIEQYMRTTFDVREEPVKVKIISDTGGVDEDEAKEIIRGTITENDRLVAERSIILISLAFLIFAIIAFTKGPVDQVQYYIMSLTLVALLIVGVVTPMIDMEAKIAQLDFRLFDHPIHFENQVLFFQSKSIIDVFWIMIKHEELQMKLVGLLMICFSIIFPLIKMISTLFYYYNYCQARERKFFNFFVVQSGKWSMADVMVVAIFMAFIGFNGIVNSQLGQLRSYTDELEILTTNGTSLQPGFYTFLTYVILAMFMSTLLRARPRENC